MARGPTTPGTPGSNATVNGLDLALSGPGCQTLGVGSCVGNAFVPTTNESKRGPGLTYHRLDNAEGIFCPALRANSTSCAGQYGTYTVMVNAFDVPSLASGQPQPFTIAIWGDVEWL